MNAQISTKINIAVIFQICKCNNSTSEYFRRYSSHFHFILSWHVSITCPLFCLWLNAWANASLCPVCTFSEFTQNLAMCQHPAGVCKGASLFVCALQCVTSHLTNGAVCLKPAGGALSKPIKQKPIQMNCNYIDMNLHQICIKLKPLFLKCW